MAVTVFPAPTTGSTSKVFKTVFINSTQSWTAPTGVSLVEVTLCGGGGGGGGSQGTANGQAGGGGGGGVVTQQLTVTPGTSYTVTIGAGGAGGADTNAGGANGANSSFGSLLTAFGGGGGSSASFIMPGSIPGGSGGGWGAGSGGGAHPFAYTWNTGTLFFNTNSVTAVQGTLGYQPPAGIRVPGNIGLNGYGAGGGGGNNLGAPTNYAVRGGFNAGNGGYQGTINPTNGVANFGGGGGGACADAGGTATAGGSGGSGACIIRFWE